MRSVQLLVELQVENSNSDSAISYEPAIFWYVNVGLKVVHPINAKEKEYFMFINNATFCQE